MRSLQQELVQLRDLPAQIRSLQQELSGLREAMDGKQDLNFGFLHRAPIDLGIGCPVRQSSVYQDTASFAGSRLYPHGTGRRYFFHTDWELQPWVEIDLGAVRTVGEIIVWNREEEDNGAFGARAIPLDLRLSTDGEKWQRAASRISPFGGRLTNDPWIVRFDEGIRTRYVRLTATRETYLHLDYIEVRQFVPAMRYGSAVNLHRGDGGDAGGDVRCDYLHRHNHGFYSNVFTALQDLIALERAGIDVRRVDLSFAFRFFKDVESADVYADFFAPGEPGEPGPAGGEDAPPFEAWDVHRRYHHLPLQSLRSRMQRHFTPAPAVFAESRRMAEAAGLSPGHTLAIYYRGTDKSTELPLVPIERYIEVARRILAQEPYLEILAQTDQQQAREAIVAAFPDRCRFFADLPVTAGSVGIHHLDVHDVFGMSRKEFAIRMMGVVMLVSACRYVITSTGNVGAAIAIHRGHAERLFQVDTAGAVVGPAD